VNSIVCVKQTPDLQQVRIRKETREPILENVPLTIGDIDKNALEEAVRLKDAQGGKVTLVSVGGEELEETIKEGLAMGADEAVLVVDPQLDGAESAIVAAMLAKAIQKVGDYDLILLGEGSSDNYSGQVGPRLAELLDLPQVTFVRTLSVEGTLLRATRNMDDCLEVVEVELPAVVTVLSEINEARIPAVTQILKAGRKPKQVWSPEDLDVAVASLEIKVRTISNKAPLQERKQIIFKDDADTAVAKLVLALKSDGAVGGY